MFKKKFFIFIFSVKVMGGQYPKKTLKQQPNLSFLQDRLSWTERPTRTSPLTVNLRVSRCSN